MNGTSVQNVSDFLNLTDEEYIELHLGPKRALELSYMIILSFVYVIIFIMGAVGNVLVVIVILKFRFMRENMTNLYLCNLAVTDLLSIIAGKFWSHDINIRWSSPTLLLFFSLCLWELLLRNQVFLYVAWIRMTTSDVRSSWQETLSERHERITIAWCIDVLVCCTGIHSSKLRKWRMVKVIFIMMSWYDHFRAIFRGFRRLILLNVSMKIDISIDTLLQ